MFLLLFFHVRIQIEIRQTRVIKTEVPEQNNWTKVSSTLSYRARQGLGTAYLLCGQYQSIANTIV